MEQENGNIDPTRTHVVLTPGSTIAHYRIVEKIGAGGMGEVYLADDTKLDRKVALKFLPSHAANDSDTRARFIREAKAAAKLDHPNIVTIHEVGEHQGRPYFAMQYVKGSELHQYCHTVKISLPQVVELIAQIADGLAKAHAEGITHRDIKSANILVDRDLRPKILDFGLAAVAGGEMLTKTGSTLGTVSYMSPEQARGQEVDQRSDLFSLGIVMYELIAGKTPFRRDSDAATLHAIVNEEADPLARYKADVPDEIQRIVSRCLAKDPNQRFQSAADLAADLRFAYRNLDPTLSRTSGQVTTTQPSIAVLPFANMSADPENEFFSDGLTEELLNVLAKNPELKVAGRTSCFAFKGKQEDLREIGKKLGVGTLLEGSVRKAGNRVRITAQLVNASDGFHLWTETYDRVIEDIFEVQDNIARAVSEALHVTLLGAPVTKATDDPESYELVLRAHQMSLQMTKSSVSLAKELFQKAGELDPNNALAWTGLGWCICLGHAFGFEEGPADAYLDGKGFIEKALELDPDLARAHVAMGWVYAAFEFRFRDAIVAFRKAQTLEPNNKDITSSLASLTGILGGFDDSLKMFKEVIKSDPLNPEAHMNYGRVAVYAGQFDLAISLLSRSLELSPGLTTANVLLGHVYLLQGKPEEALAAVKREDADGYRNTALAIIYHEMGNTEESDKALAHLLETGGDHWGFQLACVYAQRGEADKAFEWLEVSASRHDAGIPATKTHPSLRKLHSDPRWLPFLRKVNLAD